MIFIVRRLPIAWQAKYWAWRATKLRHTSHFRIDAIRGLRDTAGITLKDAQMLINDEFEKMK